MRAVDTNVLVYSEIVSRPHYRKARQALTELTEGDIPVGDSQALYLRVSEGRHPSKENPPACRHDRSSGGPRSDPGIPFTSSSATKLPDRFNLMRNLLLHSGATGNLVHDGHIAALCTENERQ